MVFRRPGDPRQIHAAELNRWNATADSTALRQPGIEEIQLPDEQHAWPVFVRNDSGAARERFDCMSLGAPIIDLELDGSVDLAFVGAVADEDKTPVILLADIGAGEIGRGVIHGLALAKVAAGSTTDKWATPNAAGHNLTPGSGKIKLLAPPTVGSASLVPVMLGFGGSDAGLAVTPGGGIPARTGESAPYSWGAATCNLIDPATGNFYSPNRDEVIRNMVPVAIEGGRLIQLKSIGGIYFIDVDSCPVDASS